MNPLLKKRIKSQIKVVTQPLIRKIAPPPAFPDAPAGVNGHGGTKTSTSRYYFERFLRAHQQMMTGRVLEISPQPSGFPHLSDSDQVEHCATGDGDSPLEMFRALPSDYYDCVVASETLEYVFELREVADELYRILKPGGSLLLSVAASQPFGNPPGKVEYWRMTANSCRLLFAEPFGDERVEVETYGNFRSCLATIAAIPADELGEEALSAVSDLFVQGVCLRAVKAPEVRKPGAR